MLYSIRMLISFIGSFNSGKTTLGAKVFADLKDRGIVSEFIPEVARLYIAKRRVTSGLLPTDPLILSDQDQLEIFKLQLEAEQLMVSACSDNIVIVTDSSPFNSLLYMDPEFTVTQDVIDIIVKARSYYDSIQYKVYICNPIKVKKPLSSDQALAHGPETHPPGSARPLPLDPNRIHGPELSSSIQGRVDSYFGVYSFVKLLGSSADRTEFVINDILRDLKC